MNLNDIHRGVHKPNRASGSAAASAPAKARRPAAVTRANGRTTAFRSRPIFQGGTMPLVRRIPKRGFNNRWAKTVAVVNVGDLNDAFKSGDQVTPESLAAANLVQGRVRRIEDPRQRRSHQEIENFRPSLQQVGDRKNHRGRRRSDRAPRPKPVVKQKPTDKKKK